MNNHKFPRISGRMPYVAIDGCIGTGKTTLAKNIAAFAKAVPLAENLREAISYDFLADIYSNKKKFGLELELILISLRFSQLRNFDFKSLNETAVVSDFNFEKGLIFAQINLDNEQLRIYRTAHKYYNKQVSAPDIVLYLDGATEMVMQRIQKRAYEYERSIPEEYIDRLLSNYRKHYQKIRNCVKIQISEFASLSVEEFALASFEKLRWAIGRMA